MPQSAINAASLTTLDLDPAPIRQEWVLEGQPTARCRLWSDSSDGTTAAMVWDCTAGRFRWYFGGDEIVHIIEGEVIVSGDGEPERRLGPGDAALFRAGTWATWHVPNYVRKHAICRDSLPVFVTLPMRATRKAKQIANAIANRLVDRVTGLATHPSLPLGVMAAVVG
jgi:hypothetical protein